MIGNEEKLLPAMENSVLNTILQEQALALRDSPDAVGEALRAWAFIGRDKGCYSNFEVRQDAQPINPTVREFQILMGRKFDPKSDGGTWGDPDQFYLDRMEWYSHPNGIEFGWLWDSDGHLCFLVPELANKYYSGVVENTDCKCSYGWSFRERRDDRL